MNTPPLSTPPAARGTVTDATQNLNSAEKISVMQICGAMGAGGAEAFFVRVVKALHAHPAVRVIPVVRHGSWIAERLNAAGIVYSTCGFGGKFDFLTRLRMKHLIRTTKPDLAQSWMNRASSFLPRGIIPTVGRLGGYYDLKYYQGIDWLLGNTPDLCRYITEGGFPADRVVYMPNFVDLPPHGFKLQGDSIRSRYGIPENAPVLLLAGRLHENKGFDVALRAVAQLPNTVHVLLAGSGPEENALRALAADENIADRVHFLGWVNSITPLCASADIFVVPSRKEPLGNVLLEGWAHAMPLIAAAAEGPRQTISDGQNGLLVPIDDSAALANAIRRVLDSPTLATELAETGLMTLHARFSQEAVMNRLLDFYRQVKQSSEICVA